MSTEHKKIDTESQELNEVLGNEGIEMSELTTKEQLEQTHDADEEETELSEQSIQGRQIQVDSNKKNKEKVKFKIMKNKGMIRYRS